MVSANAEKIANNETSRVEFKEYPDKDNSNLIGQYGWICPKCGYVWALWVAGCGNCNHTKTVVASSTG